TDCTVTSFRTLSSTPAVPACAQISNITNGQTAVPVSTNLVWNAVSGADAYTVRVGTSANGTEIVNNVEVTTTSFSFATPLAYNTTYYVRITPKNSAGNASGCPVISFTTENEPVSIPACTQISNIANNQTNVPISTNLVWNAVADATSYTVRVGTSANGTEVIDNQEVTTTNFSFANPLAYNTTYYVQITPKNSAGNASGCPVISFTTESQPVSIPACTEITYPYDGVTNVDMNNVNLQWNASAGATSYKISVGTSSVTTDILPETSVTTTSYILPALEYDKTYYIRVVPSNAAGDAVGCGTAEFKVTATVALPECTEITYPYVGAPNVDISNLNVQWETVTGTTSYRITLGTATDTTDVVDTTTTETNYVLPPLNYDTTYYLFVYPINTAGQAVGCNGFWFNMPAPTVTPACTEISNITNGQTNVPVSTNLVWNAVSGADAYTVRVGTSANGTEVIDNQEVTTTNFSFATPLAYNTTYYVQITPKNSAGNASGCTVISFTTENQPVSVPNCTQINNITNGQTNVSVSTNLVWNAVADATSYIVRMGTSANGTEIIDNQEVTTTNFSFANPLAYNTTYYVQITPKNSAGNASGCTVISFTTENEPVSVPACTNITVPSRISEVAVATPILWDAVTDADGYFVNIGTTSGGSDLAQNVFVTNNFYQLPNPLPENTVIYVRIVPSNAGGNAVGCGEFIFKTVAVHDDTKYGISPNGDGINDYWVIKGIENNPENTVYIYNRWGNLVFKISGYDNQTKVFAGEANQLKGLGANKLPDGTYFFKIEINEPHSLKKLSGPLEVRR
ncbi:MAG: gliding motility-associated C-terminal domain-containing protein, partial [Capnocytophaga sp.]|nr:gliding motility-associated C-terminal domain-containing protein [Capnocytophaga sp.]